MFRVEKYEKNKLFSNFSLAFIYVVGSGGRGKNVKAGRRVGENQS